jgi:hypothetical protein
VDVQYLFLTNALLDEVQEHVSLKSMILGFRNEVIVESNLPYHWGSIDQRLERFQLRVKSGSVPRMNPECA